jgi:hypothetical protein
LLCSRLRRRVRAAQRLHQRRNARREDRRRRIIGQVFKVRKRQRG